jgi:hypothetical protein
MIEWLMTFKEIIAVYSENQTEPNITLRGKNTQLWAVKAGGTDRLGFKELKICGL